MSYTWKSIWATKGVLMEGVGWKVGNGVNISVNGDYWIPDLSLGRLSELNLNLNDARVTDFIDPSNRIWKEEVIKSTFLEDVAEKILSIPLSETPHEDFQVWRAEASGDYTVRSAYKLLQGNADNPSAYAIQEDYKSFYKKLWLLDIPYKIKITV